MAIELSNIIFTDQDDVVPLSGVEEIVNTGVSNALAGNDVIIGTGVYGFENLDSAIFNTDDGNDIITGTGTINGITIGSHSTLETGKGNDVITGTTSYAFTDNLKAYGLLNRSIFNTDDGNDTITGTGIIYGLINGTGALLDTGKGNDIINSIGYSGLNFGTINTDEGEDSIIVEETFLNRGGVFLGDDNDLLSVNVNYNHSFPPSRALENYDVIETGDGNDIITSNKVIYNADAGVIDTGNGEDSIIIVDTMGFGFDEDIRYQYGIQSYGTINTGNGNDSIIADAGFDSESGSSIFNRGIINTGNGEDSIIISRGIFSNPGDVFLGDGNDSIIANAYLFNRAIENVQAIETGDGDDIITSSGVIYNQGVINTGNGNDSIIADGGVDENGNRYSIKNNGGAINMGDGNDSIIANEGFESGSNSSGAWFLGEGNDYIKGFGSGDFYGGNGNDTLELTPGTYTVGIWGEGGESPIFTKGDQLMITSEFEKLKAGNTIYDFTSLTAGQIIFVA